MTYINTPLSSLRAKRGNPEANAAQSGLPRRCAPRNDENLRAFAPSRETNLLFSSREAAKARKWIVAFAVICLLATITPVFACIVKPPAMSDRQLDQNSEVIVKGVFIVIPEFYSGTKVQFAAGSLNSTYVVKGRKAGAYRISQKGVDLACQSWGWQPPNKKRGARYAGKFWLFRQLDGRYAIVKFLQYPSL